MLKVPCLKVEITCLKDDCNFVILMIVLLSRDVAGGAVIVEEAGGHVFDP